MSKRKNRGGGGFSSLKGTLHKKQTILGATTTRVSKEQEAISLINQGKLEKAEELYKELINEGTRSYTAYGNLGAVLLMRGKYKEGKRTLEKALEINPNYPDAHNNLGNALKELGSIEEAIMAYKAATELNPVYSDAYNNLGNAYREARNTEAAITCYKKAISLNPKDSKAHNNLGVSYKEQGDLKAAIAAYNNAIRIDPTYSDPYSNLGNIKREQGELASSISDYNKAIECDACNAMAYANLGDALRELGEHKAAIAALKKALEINPSYSSAYNNLGNTVKELGDLEGAVALYKHAIRCDINSSQAHNNLGNSLQGLGDLEAAILSFKAALKLDSDDADIQKNLSMAELMIGDYKNGLRRYEYRFQAKHDQGLLLNALPQCKQWNGEPVAHSEKLLLVSEQGLGDTLQFMRYATVLRNVAFSVSLCAPPKLHNLIRVSGIDASPLTPEQANQVTDGQWIPLLSVPRHLGVSPENPITNEPYIRTTDEKITKWSAKLSAERRPIIGVNWQGNPNHETTHSIGRSLPLESFAAIKSHPTASLLSLQKGFGSEQLETCSFKERFVSCQDQINDTWDFLETAAIIANCDIVITSDTSVAHLSGGMGKTTWLLLKKVPEWRWGLEGNTTFWYPSMRLFRQKEAGNWHGVMKQVSEALAERFKFT